MKKPNKKIIIFGLAGLLICVVVLVMFFKTFIPKKIASFSANVLGLSEDTSNLVAYYNFDEGSGSIAKDSAGNNDGTIYGAEYIDGKIGKALNFDGVDDYVKIPESDILDMRTNDFTILLWVKTSDDNLYKFLFEKDGQGNEYQLIKRTNGRLRVDINDGTTEVQSTNDGGTFDDDKWHHIAVTFDRSGVMTRYIDGSVSGSTDDISSIGDVSSKNASYIGSNDGIGAFFAGTIDELKIYNNALTAAQIKQEYEQEEETCKPLYQNHNSISGKRFNFVFEGVKFQDTDEFLETIRNFIDLGSVDHKPGLFGQEPFKSNKDLFNFWYIDPINNCDVNNKDCGQKAVEYYNSCDVEHKYYFRFFHKDSAPWNPYLGVPNENELWRWPFQPRTSTFESLPRSRYYLLHEFGHVFNSKKLDQQYVSGLLDEYIYGKNMFEYPDDYNYDYILRKGPYTGKIFPNIFIDEDIQTIEGCKQNAIWKDLIGDGCGEDGVIDCIEKYTTPNKDPIQYEQIECKPDKDPDCYKEISCFEGGLHFGKGIFRPSFESIMRSFGTLEYGYNLASQRYQCKIFEAELNKSEGVCVKLLKGKDKCTDSDGGKDYYKKGYVTYEGYVLNSKLIKDCDKCAVNKYTGEDVLQEKYCAPEGGIGTIDYTCPYGCEDGACVKEETAKGKLFRAEEKLEVYYLTEFGMVRHIPSPEAFLSYGFKWEEIITVPQTESDSYSINDLIRLENGIKVYKLESGQRRWIKTAEVFNRLRHDWNKIAPVNQTELNYYPEGALIE